MIEESKKSFFEEYKTLIVLSIFIILLQFFAIFLFTREAITDKFDLSKTGQIGDTISGITSPLIGIFAAILVYLSFKIQIKANQIQKETLEKEILIRKKESNSNLILTLFNHLREEFNLIKFTNGIQEYTGRQALNEFSKKIIDNLDDKEFQSNTIIMDIMYLMSLISSLKGKIENIRSEEPFNEQIENQFILFYASKILPYLDRFVHFSLQKEHPLSPFILYCMLVDYGMKDRIIHFQNDIKVKE